MICPKWYPCTLGRSIVCGQGPPGSLFSPCALMCPVEHSTVLHWNIGSLARPVSSASARRSGCGPSSLPMRRAGDADTVGADTTTGGEKTSASRDRLTQSDICEGKCAISTVTFALNNPRVSTFSLDPFSWFGKFPNDRFKPCR